ncbi:MAG: nitroreductase family protein [Veillonellaceae bacterium]|nr:nitroreductase family protein [Veillonellaceae bacterium]
MNPIFTRTSIRSWLTKPVEEDKIEQLLRAAMQAPSAGNQQPWEFYVVTDKKKLRELSEVSPFAGCTAKAPAAIVIVYRKNGLRFPIMADIDCAIATENIWLEMEELGLGGVMLGIAPVDDRMKKTADILQLSDDYAPFTIIPFGYPEQSKPQQDRYDKSRIHYIG